MCANLTLTMCKNMYVNVSLADTELASIRLVNALDEICKPCKLGQWAMEGSATCFASNCAIGSRNKYLSNSSTDCEACGPGQYAKQVAAIFEQPAYFICEACDCGTYSAGGAGAGAGGQTRGEKRRPLRDNGTLRTDRIMMMTRTVGTRSATTSHARTHIA